jgi:hypothetical protein
MSLKQDNHPLRAAILFTIMSFLTTAQADGQVNPKPSNGATPAIRPDILKDVTGLGERIPIGQAVPTTGLAGTHP